MSDQGGILQRQLCIYIREPNRSASMKNQQHRCAVEYGVGTGFKHLYLPFEPGDFVQATFGRIPVSQQRERSKQGVRKAFDFEL